MIAIIRTMLIYSRFNTLLSPENIISLIKDGNYHHLHYRSIRRFVTLLQATAPATFNYFHFFSFIAVNKLRITFSWDQSLINLFVKTNLLASYASFPKTYCRHQVCINDLKKLKYLATFVMQVPNLTRLDYHEWAFLVEVPHLFNPLREGGYLAFSDLCLDRKRIGYAISVSRKNFSLLPPSFSIAPIRECLKIFRRDIQPKFYGITPKEFYTHHLHRLPLEPLLFCRYDDLWIHIVTTDAVIIKFIVSGPRPHQRFYDLLSSNPELFRAFLGSQAENNRSLLICVMYLPNVAYLEMMQQITERSLPINEAIRFSQDFVKENQGLKLLLNPLQVFQEHKLKVRNRMFYFMSEVLAEQPVSHLNYLARTEPSTKCSPLFQILVFCNSFLYASEHLTLALRLVTIFLHDFNNKYIVKIIDNSRGGVLKHHGFNSIDAHYKKKINALPALPSFFQPIPTLDAPGTRDSERSHPPVIEFKGEDEREIKSHNM